MEDVALWEAHAGQAAGRTLELQRGGHTAEIPRSLYPMGRTRAEPLDAKMQLVGWTDIAGVCGGKYPVGGTPC